MSVSVPPPGSETEPRNVLGPDGASVAEEAEGSVGDPDEPAHPTSDDIEARAKVRTRSAERLCMSGTLISENG
jgi:hypothetical protein